MNEIDLRRFDLNLLAVFEVLMSERSVTLAAERLGRTQSAVSHSLSRLRGQLGDPLLIKGGRRMEPTPFALEFIAVNHSIPDALAVAIRTGAGTVLHTGDFKLDQPPLDGPRWGGPQNTQCAWATTAWACGTKPTDSFTTRCTCPMAATYRSRCAPLSG